MAVATEHGLFIDGEVVEAASGEVRDVSEPATGEVLARAAMGGEADVDRAVAAARAALNGGCIHFVGSTVTTSVWPIRRSGRLRPFPLMRATRLGRSGSRAYTCDAIPSRSSTCVR